MLALVNGRPGRIAAQAAMLTAVVGGSFLYTSIGHSSGKTVHLSVDGRNSEVTSGAKTVSDLLDTEGITVGPRDIVAPAKNTLLAKGTDVVVRYARPLNLTVDGVRRTYWTTQLSLSQALTQIGIRTDGVRLSASRSQPLGRAGLSLIMSTPKRVTLVVGGKKRKLTTSAPTVSALLLDQKLAVRPLDKLSAIPGTYLSDGLVVKLVRVTQKRMARTEKIAMPVTRRKTSSLYRGETKVLKAGHAGTRQAVYELELSDGKLSKRTLVDSTVVTKPVREVVEVGTKSRPASSGSGGGHSVGGGVASLNWAALADCESHGNPRAVNSAGYYGLYQFSLSTWHAQGGSGNPINASSSEQTYRAQILYKKTGASSWPTCGRRL